MAINLIKDIDQFTFKQTNLNKYYFLFENKNNTKVNCYIEKKKINENSKNTKNLENKFIINQKDKLFWCFYIFLNGYQEYYLINNFFITEKNFKINCVKKIRDEKDKLKLHKISKNFVENDLVNEDKITLKTLNCLALIYKLNIIYIKKRVIFIMNYSSEKLINCKNIIEVNKDDINLLNLSSETIQEILDTYYNIDNINKPINAISYYKLEDLIKISKKLNLELVNKQKKNLYTEISNYIYY